jgi:hypothetical protein
VSFLETMTAEELIALAFSVALTLGRTFNSVELNIITLLLVIIATIIQTIASIEEARQPPVVAVAAPPAQPPELEELIQQLGALLTEMQSQNESLRQEIRDLRDKLS